MKVLYLAIIILIFMCIFIGTHSYVMTKMGSSIAEKNNQIEHLAISNDWQTIAPLLDEVSNDWDKYSKWAALTICTEDIEQLEISLEQIKVFAKLQKQSDFLGEFMMFSKLVEHIPHKEGFHWEEIL